ncbi:LytTR family DNA-binding domain-containing protein [Larkinella ripae]
MGSQQCLIIEQSATAVAELKEYVSRLPFFSTPDICASVSEAWELLRSKTYSLVCLDINLLDLSTVDLIHSFAKQAPVIVTSVHADLAVDGFNLGVVDYLLKPFTFLRFTRAVNRALSIQIAAQDENAHPFLFLKKGHTFQRFDYSTIEYIQAYGIYCKVIGPQKVDVVNETISNLEQVLPSQQFLRIHKSYIVNLAMITGYSYRSISVGAHQLALGAVYRDRFEGFLSLLGKRNEDS